MSTINEHNLDELLFDYLEGNLNPEQAAELSDFLSQNPQYAAELNAWQGTYVEAPAKAAPYSGATSLLRPVGAGAAGNGGWSASSLGIVGTVIAVASLIVFWQLRSPGEMSQPAPEVVVEQEEIGLPESTEPVAALPPVTEQDEDQVVRESESIEPPTARSPIYTTQIPDKTPDESAPVLDTPEPISETEVIPEVVTEKAQETIAPNEITVEEVVPAPAEQPPLLPVKTTPLPGDTAPPAVVQQEYPQLQGQQTKRGRKNRRRNKKPIRVVPLKSDAF